MDTWKLDMVQRQARHPMCDSCLDCFALVRRAQGRNMDGPGAFINSHRIHVTDTKSRIGQLLDFSLRV
jgi:hypothetical protein